MNKPENSLLLENTATSAPQDAQGSMVQELQLDSTIGPKREAKYQTYKQYDHIKMPFK